MPAPILPVLFGASAALPPGGKKAKPGREDAAFAAIPVLLGASAALPPCGKAAKPKRYGMPPMALIPTPGRSGGGREARKRSLDEMDAAPAVPSWVPRPCEQSWVWSEVKLNYICNICGGSPPSVKKRREKDKDGWWFVRCREYCEGSCSCEGPRENYP